MTKKNLGTLISKITLRTLGVDVSPHLFRTAGATTAATYGSNTPHLATALLGHTDPRMTEEDYTRTTSINAAKTLCGTHSGTLRCGGAELLISGSRFEVLVRPPALRTDFSL